MTEKRGRFLDGAPGRRIVVLDVSATTIFLVSSTWAAVSFEGVAKVQGVVTSLALFAVGIATFLWGYWTAVQRSRTTEMSVAELYFLLGPAVPRQVKWWMNGAVVLQTVVAVVTGIARPSTPAADGGSTAGSTLAFGVLVPVLGLGLNGLWAATHGAFGPRRRVETDD
jgi:hypothetical protein